MNTAEVIVAGHLCLDFLPDLTHIPLDRLATPGQFFEVDRPTIATGGAVANTGLALHRLGIPTGLMGLVGDDFVGDGILRVIERESSHLTHMIRRRSGESSSFTIILSPQKTDRIFLYSPGTTGIFDIDDIDFAAVSQARVFHLGYPPVLTRLIEHDGEPLQHVFEQAKRAGVVTSLDMLLPDPNGVSGAATWNTIFQRTLPFVDIFIPSIEEILFCLRRSEYEQWQGQILHHLSKKYLSDLAGELIDMGCLITGFKLGEMGWYLKTASRHSDWNRLTSVDLDVDTWVDVETWQPAFKVNVVGTTGAGDAAFAGFLAGLLRGMSPEQASTWACAVGACCVEAADAISGVRNWEATTARVTGGWERRTGTLF